MHRLTGVDAAAKTAHCEECGPGVAIRLARYTGRPNGSWRCKNIARHAPGTKARQWRARLARKEFGMEPDELEALFQRLMQEQGGRCAICGDAEPLSIDHDHTTGRVRALLCAPCNRGLGHMKDSSARLRAAATYIDRFSNEER